MDPRSLLSFWMFSSWLLWHTVLTVVLGSSCMSARKASLVKAPKRSLVQTLNAPQSLLEVHLCVHLRVHVLADGYLVV